MTRQSVVIVGGGISALAAAWELTGAAAGPGQHTPRVQIIESSPTVGGALQHAMFAGRDIDRGADGFLARRPEAVNLVTELGCADQLESMGTAGAWLYLKGRLVQLPEAMNLGVPSSVRSLRSITGLSLRARLSAWRDEHVAKKTNFGDDATIGEIVRAKLGNEIALSVVEPMIGGIQAGRIDQLSARSVFPALLRAAHQGGSLMKALASAGPSNPGPSAPVTSGPAFYSLRHGVGSLPEELERQLVRRSVCIMTSTQVTAIRKVQSSEYHFEVDTEHTSTPANTVIVATSALGTARLLGHLDPAFAELSQVPSASTAMVTFCCDRNAVTLPPTGTGILVPLGTASPFGDSLMVTAITLLDRKWPHLANDDTVLIRVHVGRSDDTRALEMSDGQLTERVNNELRVILGKCPTMTESMVVRFVDALPQYLVGHDDLVARVRQAATRHQIAVCGLSYDGVGVPASIGSGRRAAKEVLDLLAAIS